MSMGRFGKVWVSSFQFFQLPSLQELPIDGDKSGNFPKCKTTAKTNLLKFQIVTFKSNSFVGLMVITLVYIPGLNLMLIRPLHFHTLHIVKLSQAQLYQLEDAIKW
jgi:hypothetical protein